MWAAYLAESKAAWKAAPWAAWVALWAVYLAESKAASKAAPWAAWAALWAVYLAAQTAALMVAQMEVHSPIRVAHYVIRGGAP